MRKRSMNFRISFRKRKDSSMQSFPPTDFSTSLTSNGVDLSLLEEIPMEERSVSSPSPFLPAKPEIHINKDESIFSSLSSEENIRSPRMERKHSTVGRVCSSSLNDLRTQTQDLKHLLPPENLVMRSASSEGNMAIHSVIENSISRRNSETPKLFELRSASSVITSGKSHKMAQVIFSSYTFQEYYFVFKAAIIDGKGYM